MWDWRAHGAHADDGFEYGLTTESYVRFIDFAAEAGVEYVLIDAEWYGPERDNNSDPKTPIPARAGYPFRVAWQLVYQAVPHVACSLCAAEAIWGPSERSHDVPVCCHDLQ